MDEEDQPNLLNKLKPVSIDENGEPVYLLRDYIQHQIDEDDAEIDEVCAVFGECNDVECSYNKGYLKRQALYACHTCIPDSKLDVSKAAGVCLACSLHCHNGHDLVELYTKRNFRCDCGNSKFQSPCSLIPEKVPINIANSYNQNFTGLYCTCARPYPDPDDDVEDDMISCSLCEDWFHTRHLGIACPPSNSYEEMICEACIKKHDFLLHYDGLSMTKIEKAETSAGDANIDVENVPYVDAADSDIGHEVTGKKEIENEAGLSIEHDGDDDVNDENQKSEESAQAVFSIEHNDNVSDENLESERSEEVLGDECATEVSTEDNSQQEAVRADDVQDITSDDVEMEDSQGSVAIQQQERNDICDNLDDISRQCEEIDKAVDDSTKQEALTSASKDVEEQSHVETQEPLNDDLIECTDQDMEQGVEESSEEVQKQQTEDSLETAKDYVDVDNENVQQEEDKSELGNDVEEESTSISKEMDVQIESKAPANVEDVPQDSEERDLISESKAPEKVEGAPQDGEIKRNCKKPKTKSSHISTKFYESSRWRENLCICSECTALYAEHSVTYLLDPQDTLQFYKEFGREVYVEGTYGALKRKFDSLPHTEKIFLAEEMAEFKDKFNEFLQQFADEERVITSEDVRTFFGNLDQSRKRRKVEMESNYYCR